ncbi:helix-turn-helix domain-containing protein [Clostridium botulinum]|uniref:Helix-turn-helix transcriptional regulator n=1 Tax=Clostridium botulinum TaxID=1491 RepID=A0A6B4JI46_CLOBO|nr:helix-turn-helix transcriptional regulator [Clostridium botulinum]EES49168.1 helix-turn-helix domain protein [Clostridium botulinum E1 str. 'BoNT E Beluga']MBY6759858.1 helix-turn-helix transcriptional regulator [Clostridium botulinum]MBY6918768.1 helix-turn-helix transcriptional regulator [Clostridium botulinum]MCR1129854.1 helix-turn-helix domain-containing protein [Clostridium botulinum]NFJ56571.1 helix-turn-helix transcriptional regulator [Clostridium botulinum]
MGIGANIKRERERKGLSRKQLADSLGVTDVSISRYENEKRTPSIKILESISLRLDVSINDLTTEKEEKKLIRNRMNSLNKLSEKMKSKLTSEDKEILLNLIKYYNDTIYDQSFDIKDITDEHLEDLRAVLIPTIKATIKDLEINDINT